MFIPMSAKRKAALLPYLYMTPTILLMLFIFLIPFIFCIVISLTSWNGISKNLDFIGLNNYFTLFKEKNLLEVLYNNLIYFLVLVFIQNIISVILAVILNGRFIGRNFFRAAIFLPTIVCTVAVGYVWNLMYDPMNGVLPGIVEALHIPFHTLWLGDPKLSIYYIMIASIWQWAGWNMVIYLAGLQSISEELYESADIDGASALNRFRYITLPLLAPAITINIITSSINTLKIFDLPYIMTGGGPGHSTESLAMIIIQNAFSNSKVGYSNALSMVQFFFILIVAIVQFLYLRRREDNIL